MSRFPVFLRIDEGTWSRVRAETLPSRALTVAAAFALASWNRFGIQGFLGPRAPLRMILTGIYGWLALAALMWLISEWRNPPDGESKLVSSQEAAASVAVAHFPLIILGFYIATFGAFTRTTIPGTALAVLVFALWIPTLLVRTMKRLTATNTITALALTVIPYLLWLAWIGRYLHQQVGHLL